MPNEASYCEIGKRYRAAAKALKTLSATENFFLYDEVKTVKSMSHRIYIEWVYHMDSCSRCSRSYSINTRKERDA